MDEKELDELITNVCSALACVFFGFVMVVNVIFWFV